MLLERLGDLGGWIKMRRNSGMAGVHGILDEGWVDGVQSQCGSTIAHKTFITVEFWDRKSLDTLVTAHLVIKDILLP
jgi:hypothetical protein